MRYAKYVIVDGSAIVFSAAIAHSEMVPFAQIAEGAGFVKFYPRQNKWGEDVVVATCYGESISLGIKSRGEEDSFIVKSQICANK